MKFNRDYETRDKMLGIKQTRYDIVHFRGLTAETLKKLIDMKFANPEETQNDSPEIGEFLIFLAGNPSFTAHGYAVSIDRNDYRTSIEGVESIGGASEAEMTAFFKEYRMADELDWDAQKGSGRCWYD